MPHMMKGRLPHVEISRLLAVLDDATSSLEAMSLIPTSGDIPDDLLDELGEDASNALQDLIEAEKQFEGFMRGKGAMASQTTAFNEESARLREVIRECSRSMLANNSSVEKLMSEYEPLGGIAHFMKALQELKKVILTKLNAGDNKRSRADLVRSLEERTAAARDMQISLSIDLHKERRDKETDLVYHNDIINKLREELAHVTQTSSHARSKLVAEVKEESEAHSAAHLAFQKNYYVELEKLVETMKTDKEKYGDEEKQKINRKAKAEKEIQKKVDEYDEIMLAKTKEINILREIYNKEKAKLQSLREHYIPIDRNIKIIEEENRVIAEELARLQKIEDRRNWCATQIQKIIKGRQTRKNLKKGKKGKGAKGKKGKGGGKKGKGGKKKK